MNTKILFFDDEKNIAETMQKNLELFDYDVTLISTISELIEKIESNIDYNLIIMDIMAPMPSEAAEKNMFSLSDLANMNNGISVGEVLKEKIRSYEKYSKVPILFYSARSDVKQYANAKFLKKPVLAKTIDEEIKLLLNIK